MQKDTVEYLRDAKNRAEKARQSVRIILGYEEPLTRQEATISAHNEKIKDFQSVFVSYSHKDESEKDRLLSHLGVLRRVALIELWNDDQIVGGSDWEAEINIAMNKASVAILLISANFLNSEFISRKEVPALLERRKNEGVTVFPVIAKACAWSQVDWLAKMNVRPKNGRPVWSDNGSHVDDDLAFIADEIAQIVKKNNRAV